MAFATQNVRTTVFGNLRVTYGDWTGSVGDAPGTVTVAGGRVYLADFNDLDGGTPTMIRVPVSISSSGSTTTVTVDNQASVTTGQFLIISA